MDVELAVHLHRQKATELANLRYEIKKLELVIKDKRRRCRELRFDIAQLNEAMYPDWGKKKP